MQEVKDKKVVFTFGRFQPPTSGHQLLIEKVQQVAKKLGAEHRIYPSPSHDASKNPLSHSDKVKYMKKMFKGANIMNDKKMINPFKVAEQLSEQGYTHVTMVVGSDRVNEFKKAIGKYVGPDGYNFKFNVVSAGKRDPDAEGVVGMSGSKMRQAVKDNDLASFSNGVPSGMNKRDIQGLFKAIKKGLTERRVLNFSEHDEYTVFEEKKKILKEPEVLDALVKKLMDKGMQKDKAYAIATAQLQKQGVLKKGTHDLAEKVYKDSGLGKWFGAGGKGGVGKGGWDRYNTKGERIGKCGDAKPGEGKPKCLSKAKADKLRKQGGKKAIANAVKRKKAKDPQTDRPGTGNKPINVSNRIDKDPKKKGIQDSFMKSFKNYIDEANKPTNPELWSQAKSKARAKFDVYPSAYANAWASKWYKSKGGGWRKTEEVEESYDWSFLEEEGLPIMEAEYQGKKVKLNDPIRTSEVSSKKFKVYVKDGDKVKVVRFGDPNMDIKRDDPNRRKNFRARHNCDNPGPKTKARYWSCIQWRAGAKVDN